MWTHKPYTLWTLNLTLLQTKKTEVYTPLQQIAFYISKDFPVSPIKNDWVRVTTDIPKDKRKQLSSANICWRGPHKEEIYFWKFMIVAINYMINDILENSVHFGVIFQTFLLELQWWKLAFSDT